MKYNYLQFSIFLSSLPPSKPKSPSDPPLLQSKQNNLIKTTTHLPSLHLFIKPCPNSPKPTTGTPLSLPIPFSPFLPTHHSPTNTPKPSLPSPQISDPQPAINANNLPRPYLSLRTTRNWPPNKSRQILYDARAGGVGSKVESVKRAAISSRELVSDRKEKGESRVLVWLE